MAVKTVKDLEKLQRQISEQFDRFLETQPGETRPPQPEDLPALIDEARASLDAAIRQRDEALRIADLRIERQKKELAALEAGLERAKAAVEQPSEKRTAKGKKNGVEEW